MIEYKFFIDNNFAHGDIKFYLQKKTFDRFYNGKMTNGVLEFEEFDPHANIEIAPLFKIKDRLTENPTTILKAIAEGLKEHGIMPEVDKSQIMAAEATSKERKEQIDWFRKIVETHLFGKNNG